MILKSLPINEAYLPDFIRFSLGLTGKSVTRPHHIELGTGIWSVGEVRDKIKKPSTTAILDKNMTATVNQLEDKVRIFTEMAIRDAKGNYLSVVKVDLRIPPLSEVFQQIQIRIFLKSRTNDSELFLLSKDGADSLTTHEANMALRVDDGSAEPEEPKPSSWPKTTGIRPEKLPDQEVPDSGDDSSEDEAGNDSTDGIGNPENADQFIAAIMGSSVTEDSSVFGSIGTKKAFLSINAGVFAAMTVYTRTHYE